MKKLRNILILSLSFFLIGCGNSPNSYNKNWGKWSFHSYNFINGIKSITEMSVDNKTFKILTNRDFAKDKNHAYYRGKIIEGADGASFELAEKNGYTIPYGIDKNHVYMNGHRIENSDPATFSRVQESDNGRIIDPCYWKDKGQVYFGSWTLKNADPKTFEIIDYDEKYAKDEKRVFLQEYLLSKLDPNTVKILGYPYSKDSNSVYCGNVPMLVKYPETFEVTKAADSRYEHYYFSLENLLKDHPEMTHCDTIDNTSFFYSKDGYAKAKGQYFSGFSEIEKPDSLDLEN